MIFDSYDHEIEGCFYIKTSIKGPGAPPEVDEIFDRGCKCTAGQCLFPKCECLQAQNNYLNVSGRRQISQSFLNESCSPVLECHETCACSAGIETSLRGESNQFQLLSSNKVCVNRWVQFGPLGSLKVFKTLSNGYGLCSSNNVSAGQFICEYAGEVIGKEEAERRILSNSTSSKMNYVFVLNEYFGNDRVITCVDPAVFGNVGRYINHSCEPNSVVVPVRIASPVPHLCIFSMKDISADEEITFDYSAGGKGIGTFGRKCLCGTSKCRGLLPTD